MFTFSLSVTLWYGFYQYVFMLRADKSGLSPKYIAAEPLEFSDMTSNEVMEMNCDDI